MTIIAVVVGTPLLLFIAAIAASIHRTRTLRRRYAICHVAAERGLSVRLQYVDKYGVRSERILDPKAVEEHQVMGWCHLRRAKRHFRYDRMQSIEVVGESSRSCR